MRHAGTEYAYVLEGTLTLQVEFDVYELTRGDSMHFDSTVPHMFANRGSVPAKGVWFVLGRRDPVSDPAGAVSAPPVSSAISAVDVLRRLDSFEQ